MPKVVREDIDALNAVLTVTIAKEDYEPKFKKELNELKDKATIKGFRKGKTPINFLKKMYGKSLLSEIVIDLLQNELTQEIATTKTRYIGQPIPREDQNPVDFNPNSLEDYTFKFDAGMFPEFHIKGVDAESEYEVYKIEISAEKIHNQLQQLLKLHGSRVDVEGAIEGNDLLIFSARELDGDELKTDGWETTFSITFDSISEGEVKTELATKKKGEVIRFNIYELDKEASREEVEGLLLNFNSNDFEKNLMVGEMFEATIENVKRFVPTELNQEFFDKAFGKGIVSSEQEALAEMSKATVKKYQEEVDSMLIDNVRMRILELNKDNLTLPEDFVKRWVLLTHPTKAKEIIGNFEDFLDDLRWNLVRNKLYDQYQLELTHMDLENLAYQRMASYYKDFYSKELFAPIVQRMLKDPQMVEELSSSFFLKQMIEKIKEDVTLIEVPISDEDFEKLYAAHLQKMVGKSHKTSDLEVKQEEEE